MRSIAFLVLAAGAVGAATPSYAAFVTPNSWDRGEGGTTYQEWDAFSDDAGPDNIIDTEPDVANVNPVGTAVLAETGGNGAFLTGGGNIYSFSGATSFEVNVPEADIPGPPHNVTAIVQTRTLGTQLDYSSVQINGLDPVEQVTLASGDSGSGFGGGQVDDWFLFNIPYSEFGDGEPDSENLLLTFASDGSSMSLDRLSVDTAVRPFGYYSEAVPVPEPSSLALLGLSGALALTRCRRRA